MKQSTTKFLALALGVVLTAGCSVAMAQQPGGGGGRPGGGGGGGGPRGFGRGRGFSILRLSPPVQARLKLDATQKSKIEAIGQKVRDEGRALFGQGGGGGDREAAFNKMRASSAKAEADALKILKPDQKKQYEALKAEATGYAGLGRSSGALLALTDLTGPQKTKLKALAKTAAAKRDKLFAGAGGPGGGGGNRGGGSPGGGPGGPGGAVFESMRKLDEQSQTDIKKVLTPPQQKKFDAAVAAGGRGRGGPGGGGPGGGGPGGRPGGGAPGGRPGGSRT